MIIARTFLNFTAVSLLAIGLAAMTACDHTAASAPAEADIQPASKAVNLAITGMTCEGCVAAIEGTVAQLAGVRECTVNLEDETAVVHVNPEISPEAVVEAIQSMAGGQYGARPVGP